MAASWFYRVGTRMLPKWYCNHPVLTYVGSCNPHEVCRVLYNDYIFVDALFLSGYFNSILSTMVILSCPVFVSLVFESIGIRQFSTCFQNFFCTLNLVNSSFNMLFGLVASLFDPPR